MPNIIGSGTGAVSLGWRATIRFDFPAAANAIGAHTDFSGSNTALAAYRANGTVIASVPGNQGNFLGITEPDMAYSIWTWNFDPGAAGYSLDNVTFSIAPQVPSLFVDWIHLADDGPRNRGLPPSSELISPVPKRDVQSAQVSRFTRNYCGRTQTRTGVLHYRVRN